MRRIHLLLPLVVGLAGCSKSEHPALSTGTVHDSAIAGLAYSTAGGAKGTTDAKGGFQHMPTDTVTFSVGGTTLGSAEAADKVALTALDADKITQKVVNMARLLQTLDTDGDPDNGIEIAAAVNTALATTSFDLAATDAAADTALNGILATLGQAGLTRAARPRGVALEHLESTLATVFGKTGTTVLADGTLITKRAVTVDPATQYIPYPGTDAGIKAALPKGFPLSIGSGLAYKGTGADGTLTFWGLTDRGPNADSPDWSSGGATTKTKVFPVPAFNPKLLQIEVKNGEARVTAMLPILTATGGPVTGLPLPAGTVGSSLETALTEGLKALNPGTDLNGLDPEGVAVDPANPNHLWLCDEYGPFLFKVDATTGRILQKLEPGTGLPSLLKFRQPNRGFEGVAAADGKVYAFVQSILDFNQALGGTPYSTSKARFLRFVEVDVATGATKMYALPHDVDQYNKSKDAKLGDLVALGSGRFLLLEQGKDKTGTMRNLIYLVSLSGATDLTGLQSGGKELEALTTDAAVAAAGVTMMKKLLVFNLRQTGSEWSAEKAEGLAILPDGQTLAVANDNDFGIGFTMNGANLTSTDPTDYVVDAATGTLSIGGVASSATYQVKGGSLVERPARLWFIKLPKPVSGYVL